MNRNEKTGWENEFYKKKKKKRNDKKWKENGKKRLPFLLSFNLRKETTRGQNTFYAI